MLIKTLKKFLLSTICLGILVESETSRLNSSIMDNKAIPLVENKIGRNFTYTNNIAEKYIWPIFPIGFLILGTIGNILSIIIFTRREMRKFSSFCYFALLNGVNLAVLYVTMIRVILNFNFHSDIRLINLSVCKTHVFLTYFLSHLSSFLICTISIDRVISVMFLHKAKLLCTPRVAFNVSCGIVIFNLILSSHLLIFESGYYEKMNRTIIRNNVSMEISAYIVACQSKQGSFYNDMIVQNIWKIIDMGIYAFLPFIIMFVCSVLIIVRVAQTSKKFRPKKRANLASSLSNSTSTASTKQNSAIQSTKKAPNEDKFNARTRNLALMLIPVNILFLMFMAPVVISMYTYDQLFDDKLTLAIVEILSYCNFSINFFVYFPTSSKFREEFYSVMNECSSKFKRKDPNKNVRNTPSRAADYIKNQTGQPSKLNIPLITLNDNTNSTKNETDELIEEKKELHRKS